MRRSLWLVNFVVIVIVIAILGGGAYYYYQSSTYIKTDNAHVSGNIQTISAPVSGKVASWNVNEGDTVSKNQTLGTISAGGGKSTDLTAADNGTIIRQSVSPNQLVQAGASVAQIVDMKKLFIVANIDEGDVKDIKEGNSVDVTVDGDPNTVIDGKVESIGNAANSLFSLMGQQNTSGNYTKTTQYIPVKISIDNYSSKVMPGMNAEVKIKK
ncbi:HlyD family secretion protein [Peribacillus kribbensis]|uniref:HlyD family secretion protein n=1 Tax=Peribacillus kribbensis TaxID=356658 RepID=UPI00040A0053|nr:HlyD family efflux transporter periplasmic adaptor subunit [Peribacillus kribbensis]